MQSIVNTESSFAPFNYSFAYYPVYTARPGPEPDT